MAKDKKKKELSEWNKLVSEVRVAEGISTIEASKLASPLYKKGIRAKTYKARKRTPSRSKETTKRSKNPLAKKKEKKKRRKFKIPLAASIGVGAGFLVAPSGWKPPAQALIEGDFKAMGHSLVANYLFYDVPSGKFDMSKGLGTKLALLGGGISMAASKIGLNRYFRNVPWFKI